MHRCLLSLVINDSLTLLFLIWNKFSWSLQVVGYCFQDIKEKRRFYFLTVFVSAVAVHSFIWWHSFQFDIFKGKRYENCLSVLWRLRGVRLKCNLIKSDFQLIRKCFLSLSIFGEVVLFCKKVTYDSYKMRNALLIWVFLNKYSSWGWKGYEVGEWRGVMHVRMSHQSQCGLHQRTNQIAC